VNNKNRVNKPIWFDLDKYNFLSKCTTEEWCSQLSIRSYLLFCLDKSEVERENCPQFDELFVKLTGHPDVKPAFNPEFSDMDEWESYDKFSRRVVSGKPYETLFKKTIAPLTFGTAYYALLKMPEHIVTPLGALEELSVSNDYNFTPLDYHYFSEHEYIRDNAINITIDLDSPDSVLVDDFKAHIKEARRIYQCNEGAKIKNNKTIQSNLYIHRILPFLDLKIWARKTDNHIKNHIYGGWLFPDDNSADLGEKMRKTVMPLANRSIEFSFYQTLSKLSEE